jgi:hypothetical protein
MYDQSQVIRSSILTANDTLGNKMPPAITTTIAERLEANSIPIPECGCLIWTAGTFKAGYGCMMIRRKSFYAHRLSWQEKNGPIPKGMYVLHRCDIRPCINPDHLFIGTHLDNIADMKAKRRGRGARGETNPHSRLTEKDIVEIR